MALDRDRLVELCRAIDESGDDPEQVALMEEMIATARPDPDDVGRVASEFESLGAGPPEAFRLGWLVESYAASPEIAARLDELSVTRPIDPATALRLAALVEEVRPDPAGALAVAVAELRLVEAAEVPFVTDFSGLFDALRRIDERWLDAVIDLVPVEPGVWDAVYAVLHAGQERRLIVGRLGVERLTDAWLQHSSSSPDGERVHRWANELVWSIEEWADEALHRAVLLRLVQTASDEQIWYVAAGPLEEFLTDNEDRLSWMEYQCVHHPRFRAALGGVWTDGKSPATSARIHAAVAANPVTGRDEEAD